MQPDIQRKVDDLLPYIKQIANGRVAVALFGAHAKGVDDAESDLDIYILIEDPKTQNEIKNILSAVADAGTLRVDEHFDNPVYGGAVTYKYGGMPVEMDMQRFAFVEARVADCLEGVFQIIPQTWTSNGYYTYTCLNELRTMAPVWDPDGVIAGYKSRVSTYPVKLKRSIVDVFLRRAGTWMGNFHYETAIRRGDYLFTAPAVMHTVLDMAQVILALNESYFQGDKKLLRSLAAQPYCPAGLLTGLPMLLCVSDDAAVLDQQYTLLKTIYADIRKRVSGLSG